MFFLLNIFLLLISTHLNFAKSQLQQPQNIFILAGQSNMAGRGGVLIDKWDGIVPTQCQPNPSILRLTAQLTWEVAKEPLHSDIDVYAVCGIGPGMSFANAIQPKIGGTIGLVPCAVGATKISEWSRGTTHYNVLVNRTKVSLEKGGKVRAMLWYQGESDTIETVDAVNYKSRLEKFFLDLRADLQMPNLPIIQVALATAQGPRQNKEIVRRAQLGLRLPNVWCVDGKGLQAGQDYVHLTTPAQVHLGQMLAEKFYKIQQTFN
ncbi:hypothetical protein ACHQM5_016069 [Ranunculus cassubicifolius]